MVCWESNTSHLLLRINALNTFPEIFFCGFLRCILDQGFSRSRFLGPDEVLILEKVELREDNDRRDFHFLVCQLFVKNTEIQVALHSCAIHKSFSFPVCSILAPVLGVSMHNLWQIEIRYSIGLNIKFTLPDCVDTILEFSMRIPRTKEHLNYIQITRVSRLKTFTIMKDKPWIFIWSIWKFYVGFPSTVMRDIDLLICSVLAKVVNTKVWGLHALSSLYWRNDWWGTTCQHRSGHPLIRDTRM